MACSPVGLISLMDRALRLVIAMVKVRFPVKPGFFHILFQLLRLFIQLRESFPLPKLLLLFWQTKQFQQHTSTRSHPFLFWSKLTEFNFTPNQNETRLLISRPVLNSSPFYSHNSPLFSPNPSLSFSGHPLLSFARFCDTRIFRHAFLPHERQTSLDCVMCQDYVCVAEEGR